MNEINANYGVINLKNYAIDFNFVVQKALIADIAATRDLCVQLERTKESLSRQISSHSASYDQIHARLEDLTAERDLIRQQVNKLHIFQVCISILYNNILNFLCM